jgi:glycosyltransferase involved in cell wall biosynthesis
MKVGFDISQTGTGKAGCGYFSHALIKSLLELAPKHRYSLYPSFGDFYFDALMPILNPYPGESVNYGPRHISRESARQFWSAEDTELALGMPDIIHSNNFWCPTQISSSRLIYTFYDMGFAVDPTWSTETNRVGCFEGVFNSAVAADWVLAISKASREHYLSVFPHFPKDRIRIIYPCSRFTDSKAFGRRPNALNGIGVNEFWLSVGTVEPRKNQKKLAESYARYIELSGAPMPLVFAGGKGWLMQDFQSHLESLGIAQNVVMTGYVTDDELIWLYRNCYANLYPSKFEGFGLPVLEGMQFGAATVASNSTSIPEIAANSSILLNPEDVEIWAQTMLRLSKSENERNALITAGRARAADFEWKSSAMQLLQLYEDAISVPKRGR